MSHRNFDYHILTSGYSSYVKIIDKNLFYTVREQFYNKTHRHTETFGPNYILAFADLEDKEMKITSCNTEVLLKNKIAILIPAFFVVEWQLMKGHLHWESLSFSQHNKELPLTLWQQKVLSKIPNGIVIFDWNQTVIPKNWEELFYFINSATILKVITTTTIHSKAALQAKAYIDANFTSELKISKVAEHLEYHRIYLSREFRKNFKISMVEYRHQLRIYEALRLMNSGKPLTESVFQCGYSSLNQFNTYFKKYFLTIPSHYNFSKKIKNWPLDLQLRDQF